VLIFPKLLLQLPSAKTGLLVLQFCSI